MNALQVILNRLKQKEAKIGIVGMGYVGLPLALRFANSGFKVLGFDIDDSKVQKLNKGESYIKHIGDAEVMPMVKEGLLVATSDFAASSECDALIICVPTPLNPYREPDLSFITSTMESLRPYFRKGQILSLESTTYPGTTSEVLQPMLQECGFLVGEDFFLAFSPEREDPGNAKFNTKNIPKVCSGATPHCLEVCLALYSQAVDKVVPVSTLATAEMTKLLENIHRAVNIGLVNELKVVADRMGIDIHEVIRAASTKPFGFTAYYPGPGLGGHCIPIDPFYLTWKARQYGLHTRFIELAGEINTAMPQYVLNKIVDGLNDAGKSLKGSKILVLGIAYKKNVDDMRESPSVHLMEMLEAKGAQVDYSDPYFPSFPKMREFHFDLKSVALTREVLRSFDAVVVVTNHDEFEYDQILEHAKLIIDTRGVYAQKSEKVIKA